MDWLEFGKCFDWISPVLAAAQDVVNGPGHTFLIPAYSGWSGREICKLLHDHGVETWGVMIPPYSNTLMITVRQKQGRWADYLLQRSGVPLLNPMVSASEQTQSASTGPGDTAAGTGSLFDVFEW